LTYNFCYRKWYCCLKNNVTQERQHDTNKHTGIHRSGAVAVSSVFKGGKGKILDEFTEVTGYRRKAAIRLLHQVNKPRANKKRGRPRQYGITVAEALRVAWEATDHVCSKRLHPFLPELVRVLRRHGERTITAEVEAQLCRISPSTIDRLLKPWHQLGGCCLQAREST